MLVFVFNFDIHNSKKNLDLKSPPHVLLTFSYKFKFNVRFTLKDNEIINDDLQLRYMQKQELDDHLSNGSGNLDTHKREEHIQG